MIEFLLTASCALAFGAYALRAQKERLALSRELAVNEAVRSLDERLVRADKLAALGRDGDRYRPRGLDAARASSSGAPSSSRLG